MNYEDLVCPEAEESYRKAINSRKHGILIDFALFDEFRKKEISGKELEERLKNQIENMAGWATDIKGANKIKTILDSAGV